MLELLSISIDILRGGPLGAVGKQRLVDILRDRDHYHLVRSELKLGWSLGHVAQ